MKKLSYHLRLLNSSTGKIHEMEISLSKAEFRDLFNWLRGKSDIQLETFLPDASEEAQEFFRVSRFLS